MDLNYPAKPFHWQSKSNRRRRRSVVVAAGDEERVFDFQLVHGTQSEAS